MKKRFNTTGLCLPEMHYIVDLSQRLEEIVELIDQGAYFTINRARQYGKTTMLNALRNCLGDSYHVFSITFEGMEKEVFSSTTSFCTRFFKLLYDSIKYNEVKNIPEEIQKEIFQFSYDSTLILDFHMMNDLIIKMCSFVNQPIILMIDEVDKASNYQVFLDFLGQLRSMYLNRMKRATFQSVILAGVRDIKNIKLNMHQSTEASDNSPWNIASDFLIDMSLPVSGIEKMLEEYEKDHQQGIDVKRVASDIYSYTSGYPYLVSKICKLLDERIKGFSKADFLEALRLLLNEQNTLFDSLDNKLMDYPELKQMLVDLLFQGKMIENNPIDKGIRMAIMFGFITIQNGMVHVSNRIFESRLYQIFLVDQSKGSKISQVAVNEKNQFVKNGKLDMEQIMNRFVHHYTELFGSENEKFLEEDGRRIFLLYIKPIINGVGNYYIEAQTRNHNRTDIIIDYLGEQFIVEMKIWHGDEYNRRGEEQLADYLNQYNLKRGYMISFNMNKKKKAFVKKFVIGDKVLIEAVV